MSKNEPAFPVASHGGTLNVGMTLRDYFAAQAMKSLIIQLPQQLDYVPRQVIATEAYNIADAMLAERAK